MFCLALELRRDQFRMYEEEWFLGWGAVVVHLENLIYTALQYIIMLVLFLYELILLLFLLHELSSVLHQYFHFVLFDLIRLF